MVTPTLPIGSRSLAGLDVAPVGLAPAAGASGQLTVAPAGPSTTSGASRPLASAPAGPSSEASTSGPLTATPAASPLAVGADGPPPHRSSPAPPAHQPSPAVPPSGDIASGANPGGVVLSPGAATAPLPTLAPAASSRTGQPPVVVPVTPVANTHRMTTMGKDGFRLPVTRMNLHAATLSPIPRTYRGAVADPNWRAAMIDEFEALKTNRTWDLIPRLQTLISSLANGYSITNSTLMALLLATRLVRYFAVSLSDLESTLMKCSALLSNTRQFRRY
jgi:hypothetical protein